MTYHEAIIDLIYYVLKRGEIYLNLVDSGNAYDKIIRNYHQFNSFGEKVYRNKSLMIKYYRISKEAYPLVDDISNIYFEHVYPVKLLKKDLRELKGEEINIRNIQSIMDQSEIVVLSRKEAKTLDKIYKDTIPKNGKDRLEELQIEIHPATIKNNLFNNYLKSASK